MKNLHTSLTLSLSLALLSSPALAHGVREIHTHPEDMLGLAALVALIVTGGYILWKNRT
jgi:hypothetical protein